MERSSRETAWNFLLENEINALPLRPQSLLARYDIELLSYGGLARITNEDMDVLSEKYGGGGFEAFAFISSDGRRFIVCEDESSALRRENITMQLSHFVLDHLSDSRRILERRAKYYAAYQEEAREFTRRVLCPSIVIYKLGLSSAAEVAAVCGVGGALAEEVAGHLPELIKRGRFLDSKLEQEVLDRFQGFINDSMF
jgi:hypothetical protein